MDVYATVNVQNIESLSDAVDAVTGAATVILAMGAGKAGARGIDEYLSGSARF